MATSHPTLHSIAEEIRLRWPLCLVTVEIGAGRARLVVREPIASGWRAALDTESARAAVAWVRRRRDGQVGNQKGGRQ